jgi:hypothetical protein
MLAVMAEDAIVEFYSGGVDDQGRTLEELLGWGDDQLEAVHDYIQWVFPTRARSGFNRRAPLATDATSRAFVEQPALREGLRKALDRMLAFYGLRREGDPGKVTISKDPSRFEARARHWLHATNHNHLRLTRMMQSLDTLGLTAEARALQRCLLDEVYDGPGSRAVTRETYEFWLAAVRP